MNEIVIRQEPATLLQKLEQMSAPADRPSSILYQSGNPHVRAIISAHKSASYYKETYSVEMATQMQRSFVSCGALSALPPEENPSLIDLRFSYGERAVADCILTHVAAMNASSGASNRMDETAMALCCRDIITAYPFLTIGEFALFSVRMRTLKYVARRSDYVFSQDTILSGLNEFMLDRNVEIATYEYKHPRPKEEPEWLRKIPLEERQ